MGCTASTAISPETPLVKTAEQLTAEAELSELRRLTPEQEAAAAKAAQRIGEVAARVGSGDRIGRLPHRKSRHFMNRMNRVE